MILIFGGSTDVLSAQHTSRFLEPFLRWLNPDISHATIETIQLVIRKLAHTTEYAILAALLWRAFRGGTNLRLQMSRLFLIVWLICALFAASDEVHQLFVPSRMAAFGDVLIDMVGAFVGLVICWRFARRATAKL
jgi:VanZ family protein